MQIIAEILDKLQNTERQYVKPSAKYRKIFKFNNNCGARAEGERQNATEAEKLKSRAANGKVCWQMEKLLFN